MKNSARNFFVNGVLIFCFLSTGCCHSAKCKNSSTKVVAIPIGEKEHAIIQYKNKTICTEPPVAFDSTALERILSSIEAMSSPEQAAMLLKLFLEAELIKAKDRTAFRNCEALGNGHTKKNGGEFSQ